MPATFPSSDACAAHPGSPAFDLAALQPFVCPLVLARLARDGAGLALPHDGDFPAVVLRTDISGFTGLTEALHARGASGIEELSGLLDTYFAELISLINDRGGLVARCAGDALLAIWQVADGDSAQCVVRVVRCSLAILARLHGFRAGLERTLAMRIGIGVGEASHFVLGGVGDRWLSSVCGSPVSQANQAVALALAGEMRLSPEAAVLLDLPVAGAVTSGNLPALDRIDEPETSRTPPRWSFTTEQIPTLLPHVSSAIRERLAAGQRSWLAEVRRVSILFIHLCDRSGPPEPVSERQEAVRILQEVIESFNGTIDDLDDERAGLTLVAAFGLPPLSHEDDCGRAVQAAFAISRAFTALGRACSIGISTGEVFCGAIGSEQRRTYGMIGAAVNRCARMMDQSAGEILCDEATVQGASRQLRFERLRAMKLRGISQPVVVYRPLGEQARKPLDHSGLVGRSQERRLIGESIARLRRGEPAGPLLIEGEPGLGKSTLLSALLSEAAASGVVTLFGGAESSDGVRSYAAWPGIFASLFGLRSDHSGSRRRTESVLASIESTLKLADLAPIFNPVLGLDEPENEFTARINAQSRAEIIADTLVRLLRRKAAAQPVLLVLDDCQWLNSASWALVASVWQRVPEVLCVLAARPLPAEAAEPWTQALRAPGAQLLRLEPLPAEDVYGLVCRRYGVAAIPAALARFIAERSAGHPLFAESLASALRDVGHVVIENGSCRLPPSAGRLDHLRFPSTVQGVIRARIDRLPPQEQLTIRVASVMGRTFSPLALAAIHPIEEDRVRLPLILQRLVEVDLLEPTGQTLAPAFSFAHAIIQETAYEMLLLAQRRSLHADFARWLEAQPAAETAADYPTLARHWAMAEVADKALQYAEKAGEQAFRRFANREAAYFFGQVLAYSPAPTTPADRLRQARWHLLIGEAHFHLGILEPSQHHLHRAVDLFGFHPPPRRMFLPAGLPAVVARQGWHRIWPRQRQAQPADRQAGLAGAIRSFNLLGEMAFFNGDLWRATYCRILGLNLAERLQEPAKLAEMYAATMIVAAVLPPEALGRLYLRLATETLRRADDPVVAAYVQYLSAVYLIGLADWSRCDAALSGTHNEFLRFGDSRRLDECLCTMIYTRIHRGEFADAGRRVGEMIESSDRRRDAQTSGWSRVMSAQHALPTRGPEAALAALGADPSIAIDMLTRITYQAILALALGRLHSDVEARAACVKAVALLAQFPPTSAHMVLSAAYVAEAALQLLEREAEPSARQALAVLSRRACRVLGDYARAFPVARPRAFLWAGVLDVRSGKLERGRVRMRRALGEAERLSMPHDAAWVHLESARLLGAGQERRAGIERAASLFRSCGADADAAFAEACLRAP